MASLAIVEQATHFCAAFSPVLTFQPHLILIVCRAGPGDLSRYFGGDVRLSSVVAHTVQHDELPGRLSAKRFDEEPIPTENRLPSLTSATWKYKGGAVGTLTHVIALHGRSPENIHGDLNLHGNAGTTYDTELEVYADGYHFKLVDPYSTPKLHIRRPGSAEVELHTFTDVSRLCYVRSPPHPQARSMLIREAMCRTTLSTRNLRRS